MGSADDTKPFILSDPLLPSAPSSAVAAAVAASEDDQYPPIIYNHGHRPLRDLTFLILFLVLSLATFALGIVASFRQNPNRSHASSFIYDSASSSCIPPSSSSFSVFNSLSLPSSSSSTFLRDLIWTLVITLLLALPIVLALLSLLRYFAKQVVYFSIPFFIIIPIFLNVYWFVACQFGATCRESFPLAYRILVLVFVFFLIAIVVWIIVSNWHRIKLTVHILRIASVALVSNMLLLAVFPFLIMGLLVYFAPIVVFLVLVTFNGKIVPTKGEDGLYFCKWKQDRWVPAYFALAIITMIWSFATMIEAKVYVTSGTIAQWYFSIEGVKPRSSIRSSLRNAFGPSFGTVCFSGMVLGAVRFVRAVVDSAGREDLSGGFIKILLRCCANFLFAAFDFVNKFTINFAAITGESYCSAAKMAYELLRRNLLSAAFVETVSTRILIGLIFVISTLYAIAACAILKATDDLGTETYFVAALAWLLLMIVLGYFVHVLENVIDTVYICYAIDRDKSEVSRQQIHEVFVLLPLSRNHRPSLHSRTPFLA
ncbi:choline transporter-like protein 2 [Phalaenopsis equestris]|uniref:choline transporter-like protein 2 n=1 Tax=Phalaenopsis equestris TaxID=78828 RepID=UPI0009E355E2|nr:choline transporter-like protein 2 [Phalaenopsis equestris]